MAQNANFTLFTGKDNQSYFSLKAGNNEIILQSEGYVSKQGAMNGIKSVQNHCTDDSNFVKKIAKDDSPFFVLRAKSNEPIGRSEMYSSTQMMLKGIESVKKNGTTKTIKGEDKTIREIFLDGKSHLVDLDKLNGANILALAGLSPSRYCLFLVSNGKRTEVEMDDDIQIKPCLSFVSARND